MYERIAVATDGSDIAGRAVEHALDLAAATGAQLVLLTVVDERLPSLLSPGPPPATIAYYAKLRDQHLVAAARALEDLVQRCEERGVRARSLVLEGHPAERIAAAVEAEKIDLLVMGTHGRTGLSALVMGSTAQAVLHATRLPLLLVR